MTRVYLSAGSNVGDRMFYINSMIEFLKGILSSPIECSSLMETSPVGIVGFQDSYLNIIVSGGFCGSPEELLDMCKKCETRLGRADKLNKLPRTADLDILLFGNEIVNLPNLVIPHKAICERRFLLEGICQINNNCYHPVLKKTFDQLLSESLFETSDQLVKIL